MPLITSYFPSNPVTASATDLREGFLLPGVFYLVLLPAAFKTSLVAGSSTSRLAGLHAVLQNIAPARLFVWITAIHKRFILVGFYLRARAGQSRNINLYRELFLRKASREMFASYGVWTLFSIGKHVKSFMFYPFDHRALQSVRNYSQLKFFNYLWSKSAK